MKTILCYGDSNTWGFMPTPGGPEITANNRFPWGVRGPAACRSRWGRITMWPNAA